MVDVSRLAPQLKEYAMSVAEILDTFGSWAWARHHNVLSWYIRPLFLIPLAWAAYRRSGWGIAASLVALATSMFWFPAPSTTDPRVEEFLAFERDWLTGDWTIGKIAQTLLVPLSLAAYSLAFWRRSLAWGLVLLNAMAAGKVLWGVLAGDGTGWAMTAPALAGLAVGDVVLIAAFRRYRRTSTRQRVDRPAERLRISPAQDELSRTY
jgi:hypothetical protein